MTDIDALLARIQQVIPSLEIADARLIEEGMVNDILVVNDEIVFRFPKNEWGRKDLAHETRLLAIIRQHGSLPVPEPMMHGVDLAGHRLVRGEALTRERLYRMPLPDRRAAMEDLGRFLRELHGIPVDDMAGIRASHSVRTIGQWREMYTRIEDVLFPLLFRHQREAVEAHFAPVLSGEIEMEVAPVLIHGDLAPYHILVDPESSRLTGVIDFGTAGLGDPADDIGALLAHLGSDLVGHMRPVLPIDAATWARARFRAGCLELEWALIGIRENDLSMLVAHLGGARDYQPLVSPGQGVQG
ncbi:MAG TPA: phosphotransferase [Thermomicrobiales bacterium]|nr:phosphotransferase [Thermomicrobiales bacterium]